MKLQFRCQKNSSDSRRTLYKNTFYKLKQENKPALIAFLTAGDPNIDMSLRLANQLPKEGVDIIELGMPFSDPMADGPAIQASSLRAIKAGMTLAKTLSSVQSFRVNDDYTPVILMGYYNPILAYGIDNFLNDCKTSQIDGIILPDLPLDEGTFFCEKAKSVNISPILLVAPNTSNERINLISKLSQDLIYAVSILGITGGDMNSKENLKK